MPDFDRFVLEATSWKEDVSPGTFSWSAAKYRLFRFCERAYFLRHYLAQGGWDAYSCERAQQAFLEKYLSTFDEWLGSVIEDSLDRALRETMPYHVSSGRGAALTEALQVHVSRHLLRAEPELRFEEYWSDPKKLSFAELYYHTGEFASYKELLEAAREILSGFFSGLESSGLMERLLELDPLGWRLPPDFVEFPFAGTRIHMRPWLWALHRGKAVGIAFRFVHNPAKVPERKYADPGNGLSEKVFALRVSQRYAGWSPEVWNGVCVGDRFEWSSFRPSPVTEEFVRDSTLAMLEKITAVPSIALTDFPKTEESAACENCRFRGVCRDMA
ncbi:MAG: PD-(D/E)XK nuclease superfamily protein [Lentisphaerae bacterium ADurb.Bin242]|nr:MAG: PD-(D/E)XK nuclease superfamily protein [Lentisphaerae bacterium ADurb.Bin242]